ncbi:toxin-antitoxin system YwqK family antitoxin [Salibacter halophilus]|uniref:Toxin-antitoxin system YwqK family antitoxin n=1 Tax=Salibacter halophilus TaxID=1803916 RepID=A0A6N6MAS6_9FLAO|nr:hypothetical protein [Salibacter halophilus]KAB1065936.1 hypothetical protein F3059_00250 [Salibacter halophilus]
MKKLIYIISFTFLFGCSDPNNIKVIEKYADGSPKSVKVLFDNNDSNNYIIKNFYPDGTLDFEGKVSNNKFVEYRKAYFENGNPKEIVKLSDSTNLDYCCPDGFYKHYYKHGQLKETYFKKNGLFNGLAIKYDSLGNKIAEYQVTNDLKNGITKKFHDNGAIKSIKEYKNDTLVGTAYYFTESGDSLKRHGTNKGKIDFPIKYWKDNGNSLLGVYHNDNHYQVKWTWIDSVGNITKTEIADTVDGQFVTPDY